LIRIDGCLPRDKFYINPVVLRRDGAFHLEGAFNLFVVSFFPPITQELLQFAIPYKLIVDPV
jgi:hypothetical protein